MTSKSIHDLPSLLHLDTISHNFPAYALHTSHTRLLVFPQTHQSHSHLKAFAWKPLPTSPSPKAVHSALGPLKASSHGIPPFLIHSCVQSFTKDQPPRASGDWGQYFLFHLCSYFSVPPNLEQGSIYIGAYLQKTQQKCQSVMRSAFPKKTGSEAWQH